MRRRGVEVTLVPDRDDHSRPVGDLLDAITDRTRLVAASWVDFRTGWQLDARALARCRTIYDFDNIVTAPLHGFKNTDNYWQTSSSKQFLPHVRVPTLVINAHNDPFMPASVLPGKDEVSTAVTLEYPEEGGHAGFIQSPFPGRLDWLPKRVISFFHHQCR